MTEHFASYYSSKTYTIKFSFYLKIAKTIVPAIGIIFCSIIYIDKIKITYISYPFILLSFFSLIKVFFLYIFFNQDIDLFITPIANIIWVIAIFITLPSILDTKNKVKIFIRSNLWVSIVSIFMVSLLFLNIGIGSSFFYSGSRLTLIYSNPLYLGGVCFSIISCSILLMHLSESWIEKTILKIIITIFFLLLTLTISRTFILGSLILFVIYFFKILLWENKTILACIISLFITLISSILIIINLSFGQNIFGLSVNDVNQISSGRVGIWSTAISEDINGLNIFWGTDGSSKSINLETGLEVNQAEGEPVEKIDKTFTRYAVDNSYIEMFINNGIIGLYFFRNYKDVKILSKC